MYKFLVDHWVEISTFFLGGISSILGLFIKNKSEKEKSTHMLYEQLEKMKKNLIEKIQQEIDLATEKANVEKLLNELKEHCFDCYNTVKSKIDARK